MPTSCYYKNWSSVCLGPHIYNTAVTFGPVKYDSKKTYNGYTNHTYITCNYLGVLWYIWMSVGIHYHMAYVQLSIYVLYKQVYWTRWWWATLYDVTFHYWVMIYIYIPMYIFPKSRSRKNSPLSHKVLADEASKKYMQIRTPLAFWG